MPEVVIRAARADEMAHYASQASRQLALPEAIFAGMPPERTLCAFVDGMLATTYASWPLQVRLTGRAVRMAGVTQVSTHPAHRRRGYLRAVTAAHFAAMHEAGEEAIAVLHPSWMAVYRRYGYGSVTRRVTYRVAPRDLAFLGAAATGALVELDPEADFATLVDVYRRYREDRTGLVHRGRAMWQAGPLAPPGPGYRRLVLGYREGGACLGYVAFTHGRHPWESLRRIVVTDYFALTPSAHRGLWSALAGYDNAEEIVWDNAPPDDPLPLMVEEPRLLRASVRDGIMARLVSVASALEQRRYATATTLRFRLLDRFCPWNDGVWRLATSSEGGHAVRADTETPDFTLAPETLACLIFGRYRPAEAAAAGLLADADPARLAAWDDTLRLDHAPHEAEHTW